MNKRNSDQRTNETKESRHRKTPKKKSTQTVEGRHAVREAILAGTRKCEK
ncbi:MAG: hypothetical protein Ct9H90mP11_06490 [Acidimicrobiales bacterium]|nr:MAG: hypothetical protein Ct9H90mP11_06490 [Acidimicrobiales bacterium]